MREQTARRLVGRRSPEGHEDRKSPSDAGEDNLSTLEEVEQEVARGDTPRTPMIALTGVAVVVAIAFVVVCAIAFLVYLLA